MSRMLPGRTGMRDLLGDSNLAARLWPGFQERFFVLVAGGVFLTLAYIAAIVFPKLMTMKASPVVPGVEGLNSAILVLHVLTAIPPLLLGLIAFSSRARRLSLRVHRWIGTVYCIAIWISAITGGLLAAANGHGILAKLGFGCLAIAWFTTTYFAYVTARRKELIEHRRWMIRSYALTLAVVTVRPLFLFGPPAGLEPETWYVMITWLCWVPNLVAGEIYARSTLYSGKLARRRPRRSDPAPVAA